MIDNKIEAKEILIKDLFDSKFLFRVPEYQRPFSWEEENFEQLFDDISQAVKLKEENYFLGSVILQANEINADGSGIYDIVDGQQRLTTLTILLAVMRDLTTDKKAKETLRDKIYQEENEFENKLEEVRVLVRERDRDFFQEYILEDGGTSGAPSSKKITEPQKKMIEAVQVFRKKLLYDNKIDIKFLNEMIKYVLNNCILVYVKTTNLTSAFRLFSILNDRGMPLTASDLLKSVNLGAINKDGDRVHYQKLWEEIEEDLERAELDKLIGFIRTIFIKEKAKKSIVDEFNELIYDKKILNKGADFVKYLVGISQIYQAKILNAELEIDNKEIEVKYHNLITLMRDYISASDWMPVFLSFVDRFEDKYKIYNFLRLLEKKFVVNWIRGVTPTERTVEMNRLLHIIEEAVLDDDVLNNQIFNTEEHRQEILKELNRNDFYSKKYSKYLLMRLNMDLSENSSIYNSAFLLE